MAKSPDPNIKLTSSKGVTRTLDDWATIFQLCLVVLRAAAEAGMFVRSPAHLRRARDSDCRIVYYVLSDESSPTACLATPNISDTCSPTPNKSFVTASASPTYHARSTCARTPSPASSTWRDSSTAAWRVVDGIAKAQQIDSPTVAAPATARHQLARRLSPRSGSGCPVSTAAGNLKFWWGASAKMPQRLQEPPGSLPIPPHNSAGPRVPECGNDRAARRVDPPPPSLGFPDVPSANRADVYSQPRPACPHGPSGARTEQRRRRSPHMNHRS